MWIDQRIIRRALLAISLAGLAVGLAAEFVGHVELAHWAFAAGMVPVVASLAISIIRDLIAGRMGVDAVAFISMAAALTLGQNLAGAIVAIMYAGGNLLEDFAVGRAERDLKALIDRAPRLAHRKSASAIEDVPIDKIAVWDAILVRAGEVVPIDGLITSASALIDEAALTGEPIPVMRQAGERVSSGAINAGETFEMQATATAGESTYAGIVRMVTAAQTAKAPFIRMADRYALLLLPITLCIAGAAWWFSNDPIRALAVLVAATPCPLILAAPAAFIGGTSQAARRGILVKGGGPLETLAHIHTVMFDKTGTLTVGGARLVAIETAPGVVPDEALRLAASLEQASHHVLAATIVATARSRGLSLQMPEDVSEVLGSGLEGVIEGRRVSVGSLQMVHGEGRLEEWARRAARRASWRSALTVFVAVEGRVVSVLLFADELRRETPRAIQALRRAGVARIVMVTGDRTEPAETIGAALDVDAVLAERVPSDKVDAVVIERRIAPTLMVGDGINDAPALAAANVGMAMGARGASASSEAADAVILVDRLDRVAEAVAIARRTRAIAMQSMIAGMTLSGATMIAAAFGYITPIAGALIQEAIDVAVILNALRTLTPSGVFGQPSMSEAASGLLREDHEILEGSLERLRQIADALDSAEAADAVDFILEANRIVEMVVVKHEREDEGSIYPRVSRFLNDDHGLNAMSRAHREILHQARLLGRLSEGLRPNEAEPYLIRDAQRIIESLESLVHLHNVQEEDIYETAAAQFGREADGGSGEKLIVMQEKGDTPLERALASAPNGKRLWLVSSCLLITLAIAGGAAYWGSRYYSRVDHSLPLAGGAPALVTASAEILATTVTPITSKVSGTIEAVYCDVGAFVRKGQLCAKIDPRQYQLMVEQSKGALWLANGLLEKAKSRLARAETTYARNQTRPKHGASAAKVLEVSQRAVELRKARVLREAASVDVAKEALRVAEINLENTDVVASIDGIVTSRAVVAGKEVKGVSEPLFTVAADHSTVKIIVSVAEIVIDAVRPGDKVSFSLDLVSNRSFQGTVTQLALSRETIDGAPKYDLVITALSPDISLKPGMSSTIRMTIGRRDDKQTTR